MSAEQRDFMITYLEQSLEQLMMEDIKENTKGKWFLQLFPVDREFLQNSIQQAIAALSQTKSLNGAIFTTPSLPEENFSA
ncbi:MAG: hypothetical protein LBO09_03930 [Candidatus Peribacteria bacterium]|jgi:hypothetical protein|nr:hypothetical protein [Candidatus Peribacteria bacterium]